MLYTLEFNLEITFKDGTTENLTFHNDYETERNLINGDRIIFERAEGAPNFIFLSTEPVNNVYRVSDLINKLEFVVVSNNVTLHNGKVLVKCNPHQVEWSQMHHSFNPNWIITFKARK